MSHLYDSGYLDWHQDQPEPRDDTGYFDDDTTDEEKAAILEEHPSLTAAERNPSLSRL